MLYCIREIAFNFSANRNSCKGREPVKAKTFAKDGFKALPTVLFMPFSGLFLELFDPSLVVPNGLHLNSKHY